MQVNRDGYIPDAAEIEAANAERIRQEQERRLRLRSQVVQRKLPVPKTLNDDVLPPKEASDELAMVRRQAQDIGG